MTDTPLTQKKCEANSPFFTNMTILSIIPILIFRWRQDVLDAIFDRLFYRIDKLPQINQNDLPFEHPELTNKDVSVSMIATSLRCPDGNNASVFAVYPKAMNLYPYPLFFHPDAVSYVTPYLNELNNAQKK